MEQFDLVIIGAGPAGYETALEAAGTYGMKTALIEKESLGGTCLNHGCIPTKVLLHSAQLYQQMKECRQFGLSAENVSFDMDQIQDRKTQVIEQLRSGIALLMKQKKVSFCSGTGKILDAHTVEVLGPDGGSTLLQARCILIAAGSRAAMPPIPGADLENVVTSDELLERRSLYPRLLIIGGGVIGMEFASVYSAFGAEVTVIEALPRIIANMDKELSQSLKMHLKKRGVTILTDARVEEIRKVQAGNEEGGPGTELECRYAIKDETFTAQADGILICTGRKPMTDGLFGEGFALETDRGRIKTNEFGQTSVENIYAVGDVTGGIMLAHAAAAMGRNALAHMNGAEKEPVCMSVVPSCIYTEPEIASAGLTIDQAREQGIDAQSSKVVMTANGKTAIVGGERGFIKVVSEKQTGRIIGAQMMCERASDLISEFTEAIALGHTLEEMSSIIRPHPTFSEAITNACR